MSAAPGRPQASSHRVTVHIDRLVLTGLDGVDPEAVARGLREELARHLAEPRALARWTERGDLPGWSGERVTLVAGRGAHATGVQLAKALTGGTPRGGT